MARRGRRRWAIFVHDPDGDSGDGRIVGPFLDPEKADEVAERIRRAGDRDGGYGVECIVLPVEAGGGSARAVAEAVMS